MGTVGIRGSHTVGIALGDKGVSHSGYSGDKGVSHSGYSTWG